jgi:transcriptional regulator with XRE-family HTH domain
VPTRRVAAFQRYVGANTQTLRHARRLTQEQLAEAAGCEVRTLQTVERGRANLTLALLIALADALGVEPGALLRKAALPRVRPGRPPQRPA